MTKLVRQSLRQVRPLFRVLAKPAGVTLALAVSATVIASPPSASRAGVPLKQVAAPHRWFQVGKASWYGRDFQGKRTATGERFDMNALTCAHRTLPLGSWLRVTNLRNKRSTFVRVNDRGPYVSGTIVDLSYAAAHRVGLLGRSAVRVERVSPDDPELANALVAQVTATDSPFLSHR